MSLQFKLQRSESAHQQIQGHLRSQILKGSLQPGERLPSNAALARMWGVSCRDVQKALAGMAAAGLLSRARRRGTFVKGVTDKAVIGLLYGPPLTDEVTYFYRALLRAFRSETRERKWSCRPYDGLNPVKDAEEPHHEHALHNLRRDLGHFGFKGLIHISPEPEVSKALEVECRLPIARWGVADEVADIIHDVDDFARQSVAYLADKGCRRIAYLRTPWHRANASPDLDGFWDEVRARGLSQTEIVQVVRTTHGLRQEAEIQQTMERALREWQAHAAGLPDGLIVMDDVSMRGIGLALLSAGIRVPEQMTVVTYANEGVNLHYGVPVVRYEFSTSQVACRLVEVLEKRMTGESLPSLPIRIRGQIKEDQV